jgi:choline dehydrogenase
MTAKDGVRFSTARAYLTTALGRDNLPVLTHATVHKIEFEGTRAVGVTYERKGAVVTARASSEIVLSVGIAGLAQILMLSGIGPAEHLKEMGIECLTALPIGQNLYDHLFFPMTLLAPGGGHKGTPGHFLASILRDAIGRKTWFKRAVFESLGFVKSTPDQAIPDLQLHVLPWSYPSPNQDALVRLKVDLRPAATVFPTLIYPKSRGELLLRSTDPREAPHIDPHFPQAGADVEFFINAIKRTREMMTDPAIDRELAGELHPGQEYFDERALCAELPNRVMSVYHPVGTCRMGADERAVVDTQLRVRGIEGFRVADASIMPSVIGGNTNAPCIMIGERYAEFIRTP